MLHRDFSLSTTAVKFCLGSKRPSNFIQGRSSPHVRMRMRTVLRPNTLYDVDKERFCSNIASIIEQLCFHFTRSSQAKVRVHEYSLTRGTLHKKIHQQLQIANVAVLNCVSRQSTVRAGRELHRVRECAQIYI